MRITIVLGPLAGTRVAEPAPVVEASWLSALAVADSRRSVFPMYPDLRATRDLPVGELYG